MRLRLLICLIASYVSFNLCQNSSSTELPFPTPPREFRAAWVATVNNIDWPSRKGLTSAEQQRELIAIFDRAAELKLNAIVLQVRPHCDALYTSELEPWSEYLTGTMGQPPEPLYDPLEMAVSEAHRRGLELHAWFNPYRVLHTGASREVAASHVCQTKPEIIREYGKQLWLDPGEPSTLEHTVAVIMDVVKRYDIDGVHFDDYFYPYPIRDADGKVVPFPDERSWQRAQAGGTKLSRDDWRRQNVDRLIERLNVEIHAAKPWVRFGISPFGIWRPGHPPTVKGFDAYSALYADAKKWWNRGWVDYLTPQLYWSIDSAGQSYPQLMQWWHEQNHQGRHLWPGIYTSRVGNSRRGNWKAEEIINQVKLSQVHTGVTGNVHFSMRALLDKRRGIGTALTVGPYQSQALVPASPWLVKEQSQDSAPTLSIDSETSPPTVRFTMPDGKSPWLWVVRTRIADQWQFEILPGQASNYAIDDEKESSAISAISLSAIDRIGTESPASMIQIAP